MKKIISLLLTVVLILGLAMPVFAVTTNDIVLEYSLDVDGQHTVTVQPGATITVTYMIINQNEEEDAETQSNQNQIKYDHTFFDLVAGSIKVSDGDMVGDYNLTKTFQTSTPIESDDAQTHYIYYNSPSTPLRVDAEEELIIGQFQLKVKDGITSGTSIIQNTHYMATDSESDLFGSAKQDLTVIIAGSPEHVHSGIKVEGLQPTEKSAGYKEHFHCSCNLDFEEESCTTLIEDVSSWRKPGGRGYLDIVPATAGMQYAASLTLNDNINVNFRMTNLGDNFDLSKLSVKVNESPVTITIDNAGNAVGVLRAVKPKDIGATLKVVVNYKGEDVKKFDYSVRAYCEAVLQSESYGPNSELGKLCKAVLNYGKWAEDYYNEKNAVQGAVPSVTNANYPINFSEVVIPVTSGSFTASTAVTEAGGYLTLNSTIALNFEIKTTKTITKDDLLILNNENKKVDPANITLTKIDGGYKIQISNIGASKLSRTYTLTIKGDTASVTYSVYTYCYNAQSNQDAAFTDTLKTLCKAIYNYGEMAKAYTASLSN